MNNFLEYRIMKKIGLTDTTYYQEIFRSDTAANKNINSFTDSKVRVSAFYYYYIQAMATVPTTDPNIYPLERGKTIYSGRVYFYNNSEVKALGLVNKTGALDKIAIVPNPFNWNDIYIRGYGISNPSNLQISFYELPRTITIKIFTGRKSC